MGGSAQDGANSGDQFARVEWFWHVIIGTNFQAENPVDVLAARGEDQHRNRRLGTQSTQDIEPSHAGQHQIEHNKSMFHREGAFQPANAIVDGFDCEAFGCQALGEQPAQLNIIVDDENAIHSLQGSSLPLDARPFAKLREAAFTNLYFA